MVAMVHECRRDAMMRNEKACVKIVRVRQITALTYFPATPLGISMSTAMNLNEKRLPQEHPSLFVRPVLLSKQRPPPTKGLRTKSSLKRLSTIPFIVIIGGEDQFTIILHTHKCYFTKPAILSCNHKHLRRKATVLSVLQIKK